MASASNTATIASAREVLRRAAEGHPAREEQAFRQELADRKERVLSGLSYALTQITEQIRRGIAAEADAFDESGNPKAKGITRVPTTVFRSEEKLKSYTGEECNIGRGQFGFSYRFLGRANSPSELMNCASYEEIRNGEAFKAMLKELGAAGSVKVEWISHERDNPHDDRFPSSQYADFIEQFQSRDWLRYEDTTLRVTVDVTKDYDPKAYPSRLPRVKAEKAAPAPG